MHISAIIVETDMFTRRLHKSSEIKTFSGETRMRYIFFSLAEPFDILKISVFPIEKRAVSEPEKKADKKIKTGRI